MFLVTQEISGSLELQPARHAASGVAAIFVSEAKARAWIVAQVDGVARGVWPMWSVPDYIASQI